MALNNVTVAGDVNDSDHVPWRWSPPTRCPRPRRAVTPTARPASCRPTTQTTLFADRFDAFDATQWPTRVITGTQDATVPVAVAGGLLQIGALKESLTGTHYNGISSAAYNLSNNGCAAVQLAQGLNPATTAYAMFAVVRDTNNLYRWYQSGDSLIAESKIGGVKKTLVDLPVLGDGPPVPADSQGNQPRDRHAGRGVRDRAEHRRRARCLHRALPQHLGGGGERERR